MGAKLARPDHRVVVVAGDEAFGSGQPWLLDVVTDPVAHPPISMYDGTLDEQVASGPSQHPVS
jgi:acetolactate synthase I/II/III large subunit